MKNKIYVIGMDHTETIIKHLNALRNLHPDNEVILVDSVEDIPIKERVNLPKIEQTFEIQALHRVYPFYYDNKRKSYKRPYKYHK